MYEYVNHGAYSTSDELKHWKYIKKVKGKDGKWRYIYNQAELDLYNKEAEGKYTDADGKKHKVVYKKTDEVFNKESVATFEGGNTVTFKYQGKLGRAAAKGEKWVYDRFFKKRR